MIEKILNSAIYYAECGYTVFKLNGKIPPKDEEGWNKKDFMWPEEIPEYFENWNGNFGVALSSRDLVIDVDPRSFEGSDKPIKRLFNDLGVNYKDYCEGVRTGGEKPGMHLYFKLPTGVQIQKLHKKYKGLEFLSKGQYVVGSSCVHPDTGNPYRFMAFRKLKDIRKAPEGLIELIRKKPKETKEVCLEECTDADENTVSRFVEMLQTLPAAIEGAYGDETTYRVACRGRDLNLSEEKTLELMLEFYNPRCVPEWTVEELETKIKNVFMYAKGTPGEMLPEADFTAKPVAPRHALWRGWDRQTNGTLKKTLNNVTNFFLNYHEGDCPLYNSLVFNEFSGQVRIMKKLPWMSSKKIIPKDGLEWQDNDSVDLRFWLGREKKFDAQLNLIDQAVLSVARLNQIHPIKDYLNNLIWDSKPRLETWLVDIAGAEDNKRVRTLSKIMLMQAVARIKHPGVKVDEMIVLEGPQGIGKSSIVDILGGEFYGDLHIDPNNKDTVDAMRNKWVVEISEMEVLKRAEAQALKSFISRRVDTVRLAYGRRSIDLPRQCIFIGTVNPDGSGEYLTDTTGNRRFHPILIGQVNFKKLQDIRDQLFAEAAQCVANGEPIFINDQKVLKMTRQEQYRRLATDPWAASIQDYIENNQPYFLTTRDAWVFALKGSESQMNGSHQRRIANCLRDLGYCNKVERMSGRVVRGYVNVNYSKTKIEDDLFS